MWLQHYQAIVGKKNFHGQFLTLESRHRTTIKSKNLLAKDPYSVWLNLTHLQPVALLAHSLSLTIECPCKSGQDLEKATKNC
jgi:hypothetical protein